MLQLDSSSLVPVVCFSFTIVKSLKLPRNHFEGNNGAPQKAHGGLILPGLLSLTQVKCCWCVAQHSGNESDLMLPVKDGDSCRAETGNNQTSEGDRFQILLAGHRVKSGFDLKRFTSALFGEG